MKTDEPLSLGQTLLAYLFAPWHLRHMPGTGPEGRRQRGIWCRDHCGTFAGRWFVLGAVAWLMQSPLGSLSVVGGVPVLALVFFVGFLMGIFHLVLQIAAQGRVGPPPIDPPVDPGHRDRD
jgi:hypothetical protein